MDPGLQQPWGLMVRSVSLDQIDMNLSLSHRLCGHSMMWRVIENGLDGVGSRTQNVVDHLLGMRKSMGDQLCLVGRSGGEIK